ncbi:unnamed protein product [Sphagnum jensenii]|uniref:Cyclin-like domain-containing protein n=1 Tax=Sphagnum jensenii TaxID=128206 RepID=A0ABP0VST8_9BRYO
MAAETTQGGDAQLALAAAGPNSMSGKLEEPDHSSANWYFSREEIEKNSPSRKDGIDLKKETYFRKSYCTFLQDLGMRLKVPQVTIATAIVFCHRFFLRQSHHKNDRYMVATICMFIAGKVEETPRSLRDVILVSYENRFKKDPAAVHRIKQKDVYEAEKEKVLLGERLVLTTLGFDLNIHHPYKPLVAAIKKFQVAANTLAQVAWNFVNDGLRTSLCLQFKPHHIAAGAIFLAAKFLKVKLPSDGDKVWWQEFGVTPRQLEEVSNQMLELYEQNKSGTGSRLSDPTSSAGPNNQLKGPATAQAIMHGPANDQSSLLPATGKTQSQEVTTMNGFVDVQAGQGEFTEAQSSLEEGEDMAESKVGLVEVKTKTEVTLQTLVSVTNVELGDGTAAWKPVEALKPTWGSLEKVNEDKVKAAVENRQKSQGGAVDACSTFDKGEPSDEEEVLERELESGVEAAVHAVKSVTDPQRPETNVDMFNNKVRAQVGDPKEAVEEGELAMCETGDLDLHLRASNRDEQDAGNVKKEGLEERQMVFNIERAEVNMVAGNCVEYQMPSMRKGGDCMIELDKVKKGGCNFSARAESVEHLSRMKHHISPGVSNKLEHQQIVHAGKEEQTVKVGHRLEHDSADGKRKRADAGEAAAAAKRKREVSSVEGHSSDRKVKSQEHGHHAYLEVVTAKEPSGPVEDGELPSSNQDLGIPFSPPPPRLGEKKPHASSASHECVARSPGNPKGHHQGMGNQSREGHHDLWHAGHSLNQSHYHHASSHSTHRHSHQHRQDADSDCRFLAHVDYENGS